MSAPGDIILGDGVFAIGTSSGATVDVALTRGGGVFSVEREYRQINADGDFGPVQNRVRLIKSTAKLNMKLLEIVPYEMDWYNPSVSASITAAITAGTTAVVTGAGLTSNITSSDFMYCTWTGYTKGGGTCIIELQNAINLENISWPLVDKEEVINELTFQAAYSGSARKTEPWKINFIQGTSS